MQKTDVREFIGRMVPRIYAVMHRILDAIERDHTPMPKGPLSPAAAAPWRWANDQFGFWRLCANRRCRRARRCCGEPRTCLDRHLPHVPDRTRKRVLAELRAARASAVP